MADITLPDGTRLPEYALESTQAEIMRLILAQVKADDKAFKLYTKLVENSVEQLKNDEKAEDLQEEQIKTLKDIREDAKKGKSTLGQGLNFIADKMMSLGKIGVGGAVTALATLAKSTYNLGDTIASLAGVGMAFDGVNGSTVGAITGLNRLGLSTKEAASLMAGSAGAIAQMGKQGFVEFQAAAAQMSNSGAAFGLTMNELAEIAADDLDTRRRLGILDQLNATTAAKRSTDLYNQQLKATTILGKSIDAIQDAANLNMDNNAEMALRIQSIASKFNPDVADEFVKSLQTFQGNLAASGLSEDIIASIGNEIGASVAFASEQGQELFATLSYVGDRFDAGLTSSIEKMNQLAKTNPEMVGEEMKNFQKQLMNTASNMSDVEFEELSQMLLSGGMGEMGKQFALSIGEMRIASKKFGQEVAAQFNALAEGSKTFDNAMNQLSGGMSSILNDMAGALGPTVGSLANAFEDVVDETGAVKEMGISSAFKSVMSDISSTVAEVFGVVGEEGKDLGTALRETIVPKLQEFGEWFKGGGAQKIKDGLVAFKDLVVGITAPFRALFNLMTGDLQGAKDSLLGAMDSMTGKIGLAVAGFLLLNKGVRAFSTAQTAASGMFDKVKGMFGRGGTSTSSVASGVTGQAAAGGMDKASGGFASAGKSVGKGIAKMGKGIGDAVASIGKGLGDAIGGLVSGIGKGFAAFPAAAVKGAAYLAAAIGIVAGGVKAAAFILNMGGEDALKQLSSGFASFNEIDGMNLIKVGAGLTALGVGLAAFGAGSVMGALGNLVGGLMDSMNEFFGGTSIFDKVEEFGNYNFPVDRIKSNADAIVAYGLAMGALGAGQGLGSVGNMISGIVDSVVGFFGGDTPLEKVQKFGEMTLSKEAIKANSDAILEYAIAMSRLGDVEVPGSTIASFLGDIGQGLLSFMGASSPMEKLAEFGSANINAAGVIMNARAVLDYATAMSALKGVDVDDLSSATDGLMDDKSMAAFERIKEFGAMDIGAKDIVKNSEALNLYALSFDQLAEMDADAAVEAIEKLAKAYGTFNMLNPERLIAVAQGMAAINQNALDNVSLSSMDIATALSTGLTADSPTTTGLGTLKDPAATGMGNLNAPATTAPTPNYTAVQPPLLPGEKPASTKPPEENTADLTLAQLVKRTNDKLDTLIQETQRNR
jgi:hypothetical protein